MLKPYHRRGGLTVVQALLAKCGRADIAKNCTHMFFPNHASRVAANRHYPYIKGSGWDGANVELSAGSIKNWVKRSTGELVANPAGVLAPNGQIEESAAQLVVSPADISAANWAVTDATKGVTVTGPLGDVGQTVAFSASADATILDTTALGTAGVYTISAWVKAAVATQIRLTMLDDGPATYNSADMDVTTGWTRITAQVTATGNPTAAGLRNRSSGASNTVLVALVNVTKEAYPSTTITTQTTRATDDLVLVNAGLDALKSSGSLMWIGRAPWPISDALTTRCVMAVSDGDQGARDAIQFICYGGLPSLDFFGPAGEQAWIQGNNVAANTVFSLGCSWETNSVKLYQDGAQVGSTDTNAVMPAALNRIAIGKRSSVDGRSSFEHMGLFLFDRVLTASEFSGVGGATMRTAISAGL